ncbi:Stk1 family PASTA domain-containing Ser/Thr kinase [Nocardioides sp.]|uniref:Stk1 family PASTA domain-containing Ser/Thr kinase n=1 Tax=Nocardioides sp. TaxID=35761 RepID=UPI00356390C6
MQSDQHARKGGDAAISDPITGRLLDGRYRIGPRIARGGMASVYEATDIRLDRTVAVKVMHPGLGDDDEFAARFVREARAAARLSHPHVVAVYDQGDEHGTVYLAMELIEGHTLRDVIRKESPMAPGKALALLEPVVAALAAAHRAGLIHRDIKPENVLIADDGRIKVADFGLAKAVSADTQHTATGGVLIGTVSYLAPELVVDGRADPRADVYAAGVVLYEMLTGEKPHEGESPIQVAYKHVHEDVPPPSRLVPELPAYVDALVARATARDRSQRPADASVLLHQLHRVASAVADGVPDDPELTADLAPLLLHPDSGTPLDERGVRTDTAPEPFDRADLDDLRATARLSGHPSEIEQALAVPPAPARAPRRTRRPRRPRRPGRSRRGLALLLVALLLAISAGLGAWWFGYGRYTSTPAVIGLARAAAVEKIEAAGLAAELGEPAYSETVPAGRVLDTDPDPGVRILGGASVTLVISLGKERYDVPAMRGMSVDEAQDALTATNLGFGKTVERYSEKVPAGTVLGSNPKKGTTLRPDTAVDLVVSQGPRPITVRDFTGKDADLAERKLTGKGLEVERGAAEFSDTVPEGHVVAQSPRSGTLFRGDTVRLVVSKGPQLVEVPSGLIASGVKDATSRLEALGFVVNVERDRNYIGIGYVFRVDPKSGSMVPKGSTITLYLI